MTGVVGALCNRRGGLGLRSWGNAIVCGRQFHAEIDNGKLRPCLASCHGQLMQ